MMEGSESESDSGSDGSVRDVSDSDLGCGNNDLGCGDSDLGCGDSDPPSHSDGGGDKDGDEGGELAAG